MAIPVQKIDNVTALPANKAGTSPVTILALPPRKSEGKSGKLMGKLKGVVATTIPPCWFSGSSFWCGRSAFPGRAPACPRRA